MQSNNKAYLEKQVDQNNYNENELITIKTKLNLPYYTSSEQYERAYGSITIDGTNYQYVKRRVHNDTLELLCLPNQTNTKLQSVSNELTKSFADGQSTTPKKNLTIKISLPDFFQSFQLFSASCFVNQKPIFSDRKYSISTVYILKHKKPPKSFAVSC